MMGRGVIRIAFRADASLEIGTGHVMRCLTLADALRDQGASCLFLCRPHPGHLMAQISARGHSAIPLSAPKGTANKTSKDDPIHGYWLGAEWIDDATETRRALVDQYIDWLIVDHYALDHRWETALRPLCNRLMVMDDLADRAHDCDLLLDPSLGRQSADYVQLAPANASLLLGPQYALLRREFPSYRGESLARRKAPALRHLLIAMGGVDKNNVTGRLLDGLQDITLPSELQITVVMGSHAPWLHTVEMQAAELPIKTWVRVGVENMAQLMTGSDLAIGAGGGTSWERCCLGLPALVLCLANNQIDITDALRRAGAAIITRSALETVRRLEKLIVTAQIERFIMSASKAAARITDGKGVDRVCRRMLS